MSEELTLRPNQVVKQTSRESAVAITKAATEAGARVVALANEGETFITQPKSSRFRPHEATVQPGNIAIQINGKFPNGDMGEFNKRADEIHQQMQEQQGPPAQAA